MKQKLFLLLTLLAFATMLVTPTGLVAAGGAVRTLYTGLENRYYCYTPPIDSRCGQATQGVPQFLPNGDVIIRDLVVVLEFQSSDLRFTGVDVVSFAIFPGSEVHTPVIGKWHMEPYGYDGYWEGQVSLQITPTGGIHSVYSGKGYGALDGLIIKGTNDNGNLSGEITAQP